MKDILVANGLEKSFPSSGKKIARVVAVEDFNLTIEEQEIVCIVGPSGCGKSTFLDMVAGFTLPTGGRLELHGEAISEPSPERGVVFQQSVLFPWLNIYDNVVLGPRARGAAPEKVHADALRVLESVGLKNFREHFPYQLSGGMRQRAQIARVLVASPALILMDEPFGALDAQTRMAMHELVLSVWAEYKPTILFITHDVEEAIYLADRVIVMTPRPGKMKATYDVDFDRPRQYSITMEHRFTEMRAEIVSMLQRDILER